MLGFPWINQNFPTRHGCPFITVHTSQWRQWGYDDPAVQCRAPGLVRNYGITHCSHFKDSASCQTAAQCEQELGKKVRAEHWSSQILSALHDVLPLQSLLLWHSVYEQMICQEGVTCYRQRPSGMNRWPCKSFSGILLPGFDGYISSDKKSIICEWESRNGQHVLYGGIRFVGQKPFRSPAKIWNANLMPWMIFCRLGNLDTGVSREYHNPAH